MGFNIDTGDRIEVTKGSLATYGMQGEVTFCYPGVNGKCEVKLDNGKVATYSRSSIDLYVPPTPSPQAVIQVADHDRPMFNVLVATDLSISDFKKQGAVYDDDYTVVFGTLNQAIAHMSSKMNEGQIDITDWINVLILRGDQIHKIGTTVFVEKTA